MSADLVDRLRAFAADCRGSKWQSREKTILLCDSAADEIDALQARVAELEDTLSLRTNLHGEATHLIKELEAREETAEAEVMAHPKVKALVEALEFYADKNKWLSDVPYLGAEAEVDMGDNARAALAAIKEAKP